MTTVTFAATQMACSDDSAANVDLAEQQVRDAAARGAQVILLQELFETPYFCKDLDSEFFELAHEGSSNPLLAQDMGKWQAWLREKATNRVPKTEAVTAARI